MNLERATSFDDWIWVKDKAFSLQETPEISKYFVEWNVLDNVFAVTNRIGSRGSKDEEDRSVTGAFSIPALHSIHTTLHGINPSVEKLPNSIPRQPKGLTALFVGLQIPKNMKNVCRDLESYFTVVATQVGNQVLNEVMFEAAAHTLDTYYEKMSDVYKYDLEQKIAFSEEVLKNIAFERENSTVMKDLEDVYKRQDEAILKLRTALVEFYNYELQPYLDSRCLATKKIQYYSEQIKSADVGERIQKENEEQHLYWACLLIQTNEVTYRLYIEHQSYVVSIYENIIEQLDIDRNRYGPSAFDLIAGERELRLHQELHAARVQLLQSKRKQMRQKKDKLIMQIPDEHVGQSQSPEIKALVYEKEKLQEKIFGIELDILSEKKWLLNTQIDIRKRELSEASDQQIEFHDAVEDVAELSEEEEEETEDVMKSDEELSKLKQERIKLTQHQSKIRNKQV